MSGVVLHIGLPKTATTTLQKSVFPKLSGVCYAGKHIPGYGYTSVELGRAMHALMRADSVLGDVVPAFAEAVSEVSATCGASTLVISSESLAHPSARDIGLVAKRLAAAVPQARILISIRAQTDLVRSWYRSHGRFAQYMFTHKRESERIRSSLSQREWWDFVSRDPDAGLLAMLDFDAIVECYARLFPNRVTVLPMEWMRVDPSRFARSLAGLLGADPAACEQALEGAHENRGLSKREVCAARVCSMLGVSADFLEHRSQGVIRRWLAAGGAADEKLAPVIGEFIRTRYAKGNSRLSSRFGLDLSSWGYATSDDVLLGD